MCLHSLFQRVWFKLTENHIIWTKFWWRKPCSKLIEAIKVIFLIIFEHVGEFLWWFQSQWYQIHLEISGICGEFSKTSITCLPEQLCDLYYLQILLLHACEKLVGLQKSFTYFVNLWHLDMSDNPMLKKPPSWIRGMTNL